MEMANIFRAHLFAQKVPFARRNGLPSAAERTITARIYTHRLEALATAPLMARALSRDLFECSSLGARVFSESFLRGGRVFQRAS